MKSLITVCALFAGFLLAVDVFAQLTDGKAEIARLRDTYSTESKKLVEAEMSSLTSAHDFFLQSLKKMEESYQAQGNLDTLLIVRTERERFEKERTLTDKHMTSTVPGLLTAQKSFLDMTSKTPLYHARRMLALITMYDSNLSRLQTQLTKEGDIPMAQEIKKERDNIQNLPELISAKKIVQEADAAAKSAPTAAPAVTAANEPPKTLGTDKIQKKYSGKPEVQVRKRFKEIASLAQDQNWEKAAAYVDPEFTKQMGQNVVTMILRMKFGMFKMAEGKSNVDIHVDSIAMDESGLAATLVPELVFNNRKHNMERIDWVEVAGEWYIKLSQNDIRREGEEEKREDRPRWPGPNRRKDKF
jgi:hypothetical protein